MGPRPVRRLPAHATSESIGILLLSLLTVFAALVVDAPSNDPRLSVIYTLDDEELPLERPHLEPDSVLPALGAAAPDLQTPCGAAGPAAPLPAVRIVDVAPLGGPATRAPPRS
jgi:hypothetical protein